MDMTCSEILENECHEVEETECRVMMVKECRWMEQEVCSGGRESPRGYLPPSRQAGRTSRRIKKDPIQQLLEPLSNIVRSILEPIGKLLNHQSDRQPRCKWVPKQWCEERPKEWCEPTTKQKCNQVNNYNIYLLFRNLIKFQCLSRLPARSAYQQSEMNVAW